MAEGERIRTKTRDGAPGTFETPTAGPLQVSSDEARTEPISDLVVNQSQEFWFFEVWHRFRPILIEGVLHILIFLTLYGSLMLFHYLGGKSNVPPYENDILTKVHFYGSIIILVVFTISFIIKTMTLVSKGEHDD